MSNLLNENEEMFDTGLRMTAALLRGNARLLEEHVSDPCIQWILVECEGHRILLIERTYREGTKAIIDPTEVDLEKYRIDPWTAWAK